MALTTIKAAGIAADAIDETKIADDGIDSEHYNDGSIDHAHLANDCVDGDNIADDAVNSEHYVDASIDHQHLANDCVDGDNIADDSIGAEHIADNAVGLAAMAGLARGKLIVGDASGNPAALAAGSNDHVLTMDANGDVGWEAAAGGTTINNATANELVTVASTTTELDAEANLTFDGKDLAVGVTSESGWASDATSVQIGGLGAIWGKTAQSAGAGIEIGYNVYDDNSVGNAYIITDEASKIRQDDGAINFYTASSGTADNAISWGERLTIANDGFISIAGDADTGIFQPSNNKFAIKANDYENLSVEYNRCMFMYNGNSSGNHARLILNSTNSGGNVQIYQNQTVGNNVIFHRFEHNEGVVGDITQDGSNMHYGGTSDYRRKQDDVAIDNGITKVKQLRPIRFKWKDDTSRVVDGFLAHEVASVVPEAVKGEKDAVVTQAMVDADLYSEDRLGKEVLQQFDPGKLVPVLTAALKEAIAKIETLETKVAALEAG